jgi:Saccharopine dehydrogenase NADP binding domain
MTETAVGVIGAYGAVGRAVVQRMHERSPGWRFRLAGRREEQLRATVRDVLAGEGEMHVLDIADAVSMRRFCSGCRVVINCAGPSHRMPGTAAGVALSAGAHYVDPSGGERLVARSRELASDGLAAVYDAGMMPGLSALLARRLALDFERCDRLTAYLGVLDRFTLGAAEDYVAGLDGSESLAAWEDGGRVARAATRLADIELPFFRRRVTAHPYLSDEGERVARSLDLEHARWYSVFEGDRLLAALGRIAGRSLDGPQLAAAARDVMFAAALDVAGRTPHQTFLFQIDGEQDGVPRTRSLMLKGSNASALTAMVAVLAAEAVCDLRVAPGAHHAADVLDPGTVVRELAAQPDAVTIELFEGALTAGALVEEGAL